MQLRTTIGYLFRNYLQRQHRLKLLSKAAQVEKELEEDRRVLEELEKIEGAKEEEEEMKRDDDKKKEIEWMKKVLRNDKAFSFTKRHFTLKTMKKSKKNYEK
jgi:hypothetical protein